MTGTPPTDQGLTTVAQRPDGLQPWRRLFHAGNGVIVAWAPGVLGLGKAQVSWFLAGALALFLTLDLVRLRRPDLNALFFRAFPSLASPREFASFASSTWYALGALLTWGLFPAEMAVPAILVLAFADPAASVIGRLLGRRRLGKGSVVGTLTFFVVASVVLWLAVGQPVVIAVAVGVALFEVLPGPLDDNLTVPLAAAALLALLVS